MTRKAFRAARRGASIAAPVGTTVRYTLSTPATVRFKVQRPVRGRKSGDRCRRVRRPVPPRKRCTLYKVLRGRLEHRGQARSNSLKFKGRLRGRALRRGRYRLVAVPYDAALRTGTPRSVKFRILRSRASR